MTNQQIDAVIERVIDGAIDPRKHDEDELVRLQDEALKILQVKVDGLSGLVALARPEELEDFLNEWVHSGEAGI